MELVRRELDRESRELEEAAMRLSQCQAANAHEDKAWLAADDEAIETPYVSSSSKVRTEHIRAIDKSRLSGYIKDMGDKELLEIEQALCKVLGMKMKDVTIRPCAVTSR